MKAEVFPPVISNRLISLDFMRGFIMVLLTLESTGLYEHLTTLSQGTPLNLIMQQFSHHPWHGLRFWDLIQPGFMFMAGVSIAYSLNKQKEQGYAWKTSFIKTLKRCAWLFFWGVFDYAVRPSGLSFELWDVLTQLSFTTLVTFLIFNWKTSSQIFFCVFLLLLTEVLYRFTNVPGFNQPFTDQHNFGNYVDVILMNKINPGGWVAINCLPTAVHTIAGALTGKLFLSNRKDKVKKLLLWALLCLAIGYGLDVLNITPIIKRIATSSFTLASLAWCLFAIVFFYWWIDIRNHKKHLQFFLIVGMNSLFIYLFFEIVGSRWFNSYIIIIIEGLIQFIRAPLLISVISSLCIFFLEWGLCYFLYKKKIFFRL